MPANAAEHSTIAKPEDREESPSQASHREPLSSQGQEPLATPDVETKRMQFALGAETMLIPQDQEEAIVAMQLQDEQDDQEQVEEAPGQGEILSFTEGLQASLRKRDRKNAKENNYYTQVVRQLERLDRDYAKQEKARRQGEKQEYMNHIEALRQKDKVNQFSETQLSSPTRSAVMQVLTGEKAEPDQATLNQRLREEYDANKESEIIRVAREEERIRNIQKMVNP